MRDIYLISLDTGHLMKMRDCPAECGTVDTYVADKRYPHLDYIVDPKTISKCIFWLDLATDSFLILCPVFLQTTYR